MVLPRITLEGGGAFVSLMRVLICYRVLLAVKQASAYLCAGTNNVTVTVSGPFEPGAWSVESPSVYEQSRRAWLLVASMPECNNSCTWLT